MRIHFLLLLLAAVTILNSGCAGRRHRESVVDQGDYSYWRAPGSCSDPECVECNQAADVGGTNPSPTASSFLDRYNPFKKQAGQLADEGSLRCEGCQRQSDVLMDGRCVDCHKQRVDNRQLGMGNGGIDVKPATPSSRPEVGFQAPRSPLQPLIPNRIVPENSGLYPSGGDMNSAGETGRTELGTRGGSFIPEPIPDSKANSLVDSSNEFETEHAWDESSVVNKLPEKDIDPVQSSGGRNTPIESGNVNKARESSDAGSENVVNAQDLSNNPVKKDFRLDRLLPGILQSPESRTAPETAADDPVPTADDIEWGPPMPVKTKLPRSDSEGATNPRGEFGDDDQAPPSEPPPNFERSDNRAFTAPTKRSERDIIRDLRNTTVPNSIVFDNTPDIPEQQVSEKRILLTAKPVPGYHVPHLLVEPNSPAQNQSADDFDDLLESRPRRTLARPVSVSKTNNEPEFDFRPLPELTQPSKLDPRAFDPNQLIEEIFEPISFPQAPAVDSTQPGSRRNINELATPVTIQGELRVLNPHSLNSRLPRAMPTDDKILLHAVSDGDPEKSNSSAGSENGSKAKFKLSPR